MNYSVFLTSLNDNFQPPVWILLFYL